MLECLICRGCVNSQEHTIIPLYLSRCLFIFRHTHKYYILYTIYHSSPWIPSPLPVSYLPSMSIPNNLNRLLVEISDQPRLLLSTTSTSTLLTSHKDHATLCFGAEIWQIARSNMNVIPRTRGWVISC